MKILFTGSSSFSGIWFIKTLIKAGHEVTPLLSSPYETYTGIRKQRVDELIKISQPIFHAPFGHNNFLDAITSSSSWDLLCHHGSEVKNYKSPDFNPFSALANNTYNLKEVLTLLCKHGCRQVVLTGSVFEQNEGSGSENLRAVSPYGLSKGLTFETFLFYTSQYHMKLGKFVIPNPFGPLEENRFTSYLAQQWLSGKTPIINTPQYVRDNIPISLLANAYTSFVSKMPSSPDFIKYNPSFFAESQANFTHRFSEEMRPRLNVPCLFEFKSQTDFNEPLIRINTDRIEAGKFNWNTSEFWDNLAVYYAKGQFG